MAGREDEATAATGGSAWYTHPVYARYWRHYRDAQAWTQRHRNARRRALTEAAQGLDWSCLVGLPFPYDPSHPYAASHHGPLSHPPQAAGHQRRHHQQQHHHHQQHHHQQHHHQHHHQKHEELPEHHRFSTQATEHQREHQQHHHHNQQQHHYHQQHHHQKHEELPEHHRFSTQATEHQREHQQHHHHNQQRPDLRSEEPDEDSESESESEAESDVEITDELRAYFAETERHREERRLEQEQEDERAEGMVWADEPPGARQASSQAPQERPGERRRVEMARLYGEEASVRILALEAAMQLSFDQHCDRTRPKYWPIIPLKL